MPGIGEDTGGAPLLKNRYQLGKVLGRGGMCIVYQAWDTRRERFVAIKRLVKMPDGSYQRLTEEQRQQKMAEAQKMIDKYCK